MVQLWAEVGLQPMRSDVSSSAGSAQSGSSLAFSWQAQQGVSSRPSVGGSSRPVTLLLQSRTQRHRNPWGGSQIPGARGQSSVQM